MNKKISLNWDLVGRLFGYLKINLTVHMNKLSTKLFNIIKNIKHTNENPLIYQYNNNTIFIKKEISER